MRNVITESRSIFQNHALRLSEKAGEWVLLISQETRIDATGLINASFARVLRVTFLPCMSGCLLNDMSDSQQVKFTVN